MRLALLIATALMLSMCFLKAGNTPIQRPAVSQTMIRQNQLIIQKYESVEHLQFRHAKVTALLDIGYVNEPLRPKPQVTIWFWGPEPAIQKMVGKAVLMQWADTLQDESGHELSDYCSTYSWGEPTCILEVLLYIEPVQEKRGS